MTGPVHIAAPLARALSSIKVGSSDLTLGQVEALAMIEIAKIMGWPLDHASWGPVTSLPEPADDKVSRHEPISAADLQARVKAIAEFVPPTDPKSIEIYEIASERGPRAARQAIQDAARSGEITRNHANVLIWALALERI